MKLTRFFTQLALRVVHGLRGKSVQRREFLDTKAQLMRDPNMQRLAHETGDARRLAAHARSCIQAEVEKVRLKKRRETRPHSRHIQRRALPFPSSRQPVCP